MTSPSLQALVTELKALPEEARWDYLVQLLEQDPWITARLAPRVLESPRYFEALLRHALVTETDLSRRMLSRYILVVAPRLGARRVIGVLSQLADEQPQVVATHLGLLKRLLAVPEMRANLDFARLEAKLGGVNPVSPGSEWIELGESTLGDLTEHTWTLLISMATRESRPTLFLDLRSADERREETLRCDRVERLDGAFVRTFPGPLRFERRSLLECQLSIGGLTVSCLGVVRLRRLSALTLLDV